MRKVSNRVALSSLVYYRINAMTLEQDDRQRLIQELAELKQEHRTLDLAIADLDSKLNSNQLEVTRLKRQKLRLKDAITRLESSLIPDLHA